MEIDSAPDDIWTIVASDGGEFSPSYGVHNLLQADGSVYSTAPGRSEDVNIVLRYNGPGPFTLSAVTCASPAAGFTSPLGQAVVFTSWDLPDVRKLGGRWSRVGSEEQYSVLAAQHHAHQLKEMQRFVVHQPQQTTGSPASSSPNCGNTAGLGIIHAGSQRSSCDGAATTNTKQQLAGRLTLLLAAATATDSAGAASEGMPAAAAISAAATGLAVCYGWQATWLVYVQAMLEAVTQADTRWHLQHVQLQHAGQQVQQQDAWRHMMAQQEHPQAMEVDTISQLALQQQQQQQLLQPATAGVPWQGAMQHPAASHHLLPAAPQQQSAQQQQEHHALQGGWGLHAAQEQQQQALQQLPAEDIYDRPGVLHRVASKTPELYGEDETAAYNDTVGPSAATHAAAAASIPARWPLQASEHHARQPAQQLHGISNRHSSQHRNQQLNSMDMDGSMAAGMVPGEQLHVGLGLDSEREQDLWHQGLHGDAGAVPHRRVRHTLPRFDSEHRRYAALRYPSSSGSSSDSDGSSAEPMDVTLSDDMLPSPSSHLGPGSLPSGSAFDGDFAAAVADVSSSLAPLLAGVSVSVSVSASPLTSPTAAAAAAAAGLIGSQLMLGHSPHAAASMQLPISTASVQQQQQQQEQQHQEQQRGMADVVQQHVSHTTMHTPHGPPQQQPLQQEDHVTAWDDRSHGAVQQRIYHPGAQHNSTHRHPQHGSNRSIWSAASTHRGRSSSGHTGDHTGSSSSRPGGHGLSQTSGYTSSHIGAHGLRHLGGDDGSSGHVRAEVGVVEVPPAPPCPAAFIDLLDMAHTTVDVNPPMSGRYVLIKLLRSRYMYADNLDTSYLALHVTHGPHAFGSVDTA